MYLRHFALTPMPFETPAHTDERFASNARREAEARLQHLVELKGIGLLTGKLGSGKTTVCRHLTAALHPGLYRVGYVSLTTGNVLDMYKAIASELGAAHRTLARHRLPRHPRRNHRRVCEAKQLPVLVIDEAQHLRNDVLEDLRLLTNYAMDSENRLCLLLVGLTELRRRLAMACHESLAQRLVVRHHLAGIERCELDTYLAHRLHLAGCELPLFDPPAVEALFHSTRGLPRLINRTAHYALTAAAAQGTRTVTAEHLEHSPSRSCACDPRAPALTSRTQRRAPPPSSASSSTTSPSPSSASTSTRPAATTRNFAISSARATADNSTSSHATTQNSESLPPPRAPPPPRPFADDGRGAPSSPRPP